MSVQQKTILIVEDAPLISARLEQMLSTLPGVGAIQIARSVAESMLFLSTTIPDIILLDINLPGINGIELLRITKTNFPAVTVIMVTNQTDEVYQVRCKALGADHFIDKSSAFDRLPALVASLSNGFIHDML